MTDNAYCLVKIIQKNERIIAAVQFGIKLFDFFSTSINSSLIIFIRTYTVNYRNALDRLRVRMNIILYLYVSLFVNCFSIFSMAHVRGLELQTTDVKLSVSETLLPKIIRI